MADKTILQKIVERGHYKFVDRVDSWQEGVKLSCESLAKTGYVSDNYYQQIVDCIEKYGPYVVFEHYVAMPHSQEGAEGANQTAVGFMRVKEDVYFGKDEDGEDKVARLFFTLAAKDPNEHLEIHLPHRGKAAREIRTGGNLPPPSTHDREGNYL